MIKYYRLLLTSLLISSACNTALALQKVYVNTSYTEANSGAHRYGIDAFNTITKAVEVVDDNGIVYVTKGNYLENIVIDKSLTLQGEGKLSLYGASTYGPTIDGGSSTTPATITITGTSTPITVTISNFTILNSGNGINVLQNAHVTLHNNTISGYRKNGITFGPVLYSGYGGVKGNIHNNIIIGSGPTNTSSQNGIQISENNTATITENKISNHVYTVKDSWWASGILIHQSNNVITSKNLLYNNQAGIDIMQGSRNKVTKNAIFGNNHTEAGITLSGSSENTTHPTTANIIENNTISGGSVGIWAANTSSNIYLNNKIASTTETGIYSWNGNKNIVSKNRISNNHSTDNKAWAIIIDGENLPTSSNNTITYNTVEKSDQNLFLTQNSKENILTANTFNGYNVTTTSGNLENNDHGVLTPALLSESNTTVTKGMVLGASTFNFLQDLAIGMKNNDVKELQKILKAEGFLNTEITGYFGEGTKNALIKWQKENKLPTTGDFDTISRDTLNIKNK